MIRPLLVALGVMVYLGIGLGISFAAYLPCDVPVKSAFTSMIAWPLVITAASVAAISTNERPPAKECAKP